VCVCVSVIHMYPICKESKSIEVGECLLSFGVESFVFHFATQKYKDKDIQNFNLACCFVWV
jgi:hypothetical protein